MAIEVKIPEISEGVTEGTVISLLVAQGDTVEQDQSLLELETDKAVVAIPSPAAGQVAEVLVSEGDVVAVGAVIVHLAADGSRAADARPVAAPTDGKAAVQAQEVEIPTRAEGTKKAVTDQESKTDTGTTDRQIVEPSVQEKASREIPPPAAQPAVTPATAKPSAAPPGQEPAPAAPSVRRLARELGVDIQQVPGRGPHGRISADDVQNHVKGILTGSPVTSDAAVAAASTATSAAAGPLAEAPLPDFTRWGPVEREPLSRVREVTARAVTQAWLTAPQVTQYDKADITEVEEFRRSINARRGEEAAKLTMTAILLKVAAAALREFPQFNTSLDWARRELVSKQYIHIGVAVDTSHGLLVPVIRNADQKNLEELATELAETAKRTRERKVTPDELEGGTFTISNLGGIGGTAFSPIVYTPQVAILGISRASQEPVWRDGQFVPRLIMPLSLSYDHRVIDGADGARFLRWICDALRQPLLLAMKG